MPPGTEELNPSEWTLMKVLWRRRKATVREVHEEVKEDTGWALSTVKTLLERMQAKGLLKVDRVGPVRQYRPVRARQQLVPRAVQKFLDRALDDSLEPLIPYITKARKLKPREVRMLRRLLEEGGEDE